MTTEPGDLGLARRSGLSLWRQLVETLEGEIRLGLHKPDQPLPNERDLAARFAVARQTVRRAMATLEQKGLISIEQGRGTFLRPGITYALGPQTRFSANLLQEGLAPSRRLIRSLKLRADERVAQRLEIGAGDPVALIESVGIADGIPILFSRHYFPLARVPAIGKAFERTLSITAALKRAGINSYARISTQVTARLPSVEEACHLEQPASLPILVVESVNVDAARCPIDFGIAHFASDKVVLDIPVEG